MVPWCVSVVDYPDGSKASLTRVASPRAPRHSRWWTGRATSTSQQTQEAPGRVAPVAFEQRAVSSSLERSRKTRDGDGRFLAVFTDNVHLADLARRTHVPNIDIVPASPW